MQALTVADYLAELPDDREETLHRLRNVVVENLSTEFQEMMSSGMLAYVVPHEIYPDGYHCNPKQPLPFLYIANQKNFVALYHMGLYADAQLLEWFVSEYPKHSKSKLDMGKSCIRFKKLEAIPYALIGELCQKMTVDDWVRLYESVLKSKK